MGACINGFVVIMFSSEDFLQQYTGIISYDFVKNVFVPAFSGWAISIIPIATGFIMGYILESNMETKTIKPLLNLTLIMTLLTGAIIIFILLAPALFGWVSGTEGFELRTIMFFLIVLMLVFPLSFIGSFIGSVMVTY